MNKQPNQQITWSSGLAALGVMSWLIGSWIQVAGRDAFLFPYWQWWAQGAFLTLIAIVVKLGEAKRRK